MQAYQTEMQLRVKRKETYNETDFIFHIVAGVHSTDFVSRIRFTII